MLLIKSSMELTSRGVSWVKKVLCPYPAVNFYIFLSLLCNHMHDFISMYGMSDGASSSEV